MDSDPLAVHDSGERDGFVKQVDGIGTGAELQVVVEGREGVLEPIEEKVHLRGDIGSPHSHPLGAAVSQSRPDAYLVVDQIPIARVAPEVAHVGRGGHGTAHDYLAEGRHWEEGTAEPLDA